MIRVDPNIRTFFGNSQDEIYTPDGEKFFNNPEVAFFDPTIKVQRAGYKPVRLQVLDYLNAGERLSANRKAVYYQSQVDKLENNDLPLPATRAKTDFDLNDAFRLSREYNSKLDELNKRIEERKELQRLENEKEYKSFLEWKEKQQISKPASVDTGNASS